MSRRELRQLSEEARDILGRLVEVLDATAAERDDFVVFLYHARKSYERASDKPNKSGKYLRGTAELAFVEAGRRGFKGTYREWIELMRVPFKYEEQRNNGLLPEPPQR